jgi:hypothetical protein
MLTAAQIASLKTELDADPKALGYAQQAGNDAVIAGMLNALTGPGAETITLPVMSHDQFAALIAPAVMALGSSTAMQTKWNPMLTLASSAQNVGTTPQNMGLLNALVADGLMTAAQVTAGTTRIGSRAEVLYGAGTVIEWQDIARAEGRL